jgi:hypothetical protein
MNTATPTDTVTPTDTPTATATTLETATMTATPTPSLTITPGGPTVRDDTFVCDNLSAQTGASITGAHAFQNVVLGEQRGNTYCHIIALDGKFDTSPAEIGIQSVLDLGVVQAVDLTGLLPNGVPVVPFQTPVHICMKGSGEILFLNAATAARTIERLPITVEGEYTCVDVPNAGTVVMVNGTSGIPAPPPIPPTSPVSMILTGVCNVTTTDAPLNLRAAPSTSATILAQLPYDLTLRATERVPGWYRVIYLDMQGWVRDTYVRTVGDCGG